MPAELLIGPIHDGVLVRLVGRGTVQESLALRVAVEPFLGGGTIALDATQCDYLDSTFLGCLVGIKKACDAAGSRFIIASPVANRTALFSTSSLVRYFEFTDACPKFIGRSTAIPVNALERMALGEHVLRCHEHLADRGGAEAAAFSAVVRELKSQLPGASPQPATTGMNR